MSKTTTKWRDCPSYGDRASVRASYGFEYLQGNRAPYFSITGDIKDHPGQGENNWSGGCVHKEILEAFPELASLVRWHLVDQTGDPMHYVANGKYWYDKIGTPKENSYDPDPEQAFKSTVVFGAVDGDSMESVKVKGVAQWCLDRAEDLKRVMLEDMAKHDVALVPGDWPKTA